MLKRRARQVLWPLLAGCFLFLCGCFSETGDSLLSLPRPPQDFKALDTLLDAEIANGLRYAPPVNGSHRQSIQRMDIDGDGEDEIFVFFQISGEKPLLIQMYQYRDGQYFPAASIEGEGDAVDSINYVDLDGDAGKELVIGWRSGTAKGLSVYFWRDNAMLPGLTTAFIGYALQDMTGDGVTDLVVITHNADTMTGEAQLYFPSPDGLALASAAPLSQKAEQVQRVRKTMLPDDFNGVMVSSQYEQVMTVTDIFAYYNGELHNITLHPETQISEDTVRTKTMAITDLNGDGILDLPRIKLLPLYPGESGDPMNLYKWINYGITGETSVVTYTYHNTDEAWFVEIPVSWVNEITMRRQTLSAGEREWIIARYNEAQTVDILSLYSLSGSARHYNAAKAGRESLASNADMIIAYKIQTQAGSEGILPAISEENLHDSFHWIEKEWITGELIAS